MQTQAQVNKVVEMVAATGFADPEYPKNPYLIRVYMISNNMVGNDNFYACMSMLRYCMIPHKEIVDDVRALLLNPYNIPKGWTFALVTPDDEVITDFMRLAEWIKAKGMMPR